MPGFYPPFWGLAHPITLLRLKPVESDIDPRKPIDGHKKIKLSLPHHLVALYPSLCSAHAPVVLKMMDVDLASTNYAKYLRAKSGAQYICSHMWGYAHRLIKLNKTFSQGKITYKYFKKMCLKFSHFGEVFTGKMTERESVSRPHHMWLSYVN